MKNVVILSLFLLIPLLTSALENPNSSINFFHEGDIEQVKSLAAQEGKLFFIDFYADYCYACKLMDETTFVDESLGNYVKDNYIPYKVNVMIDFDGIMLKDEYNITVLPTILVFNSKGELVGRYETMLGPTNMIKELQKYNLPENRIKSGNDAPLTLSEPTPSPTPTPSTPVITVSKLTSKIKAAPDRSINVGSARINGHVVSNVEKPSNKKEVTKPAVETVFGFVAKEEKPNPVTASIPRAYEAEDRSEVEPELPTEGLFQFTVKPYETLGYGVQIGVFAQYGNVLREVQKLQEQFQQPILVNISQLDGVAVYKIIVGAFDSTREAVAFRRMMQTKGSDGVIKDLSTIKK